ncbi:F-box only protein 25-like [Saccostrea cucullata]|uniref:F-box only protein 25-like n=1 Tax=Saccostrea cuccullata TaxID=36930 RepID=UPI002ED29CD8
METSSRGNVYVKIDGRWVIATLGYDLDTDNAAQVVAGNSRDIKSQANQLQQINQRAVYINIDNRTGYQPDLPILRNIQGIGRQRKTNESISTVLQKLNFEEYALQFREFAYCCEFYRLLVKHKLHRLSGTVQKHVFGVLEQMTNAAISMELFIPPLKHTLKEVLDSMTDNENAMIGSKSLRRKHHDLINNCLVRISRFQYTQREDDGKLCLLDLPKECLISIMKKLDQPRDIVNVALTCSTLEVIAMDNEVWESMCLYHFNDKAMSDYISHIEYYSVDWLDVFKFCSKKIKAFKRIYGDDLVVCDNCRGVFWRVVGHDCLNKEEAPSHTLLTPSDFLDLLNL